MKKNNKIQTKKESPDKAYHDFQDLAKARGFMVFEGQGKTRSVLISLIKLFEKYYEEPFELIVRDDFKVTPQYRDVVYNLINLTGTVELVLKERYNRVDN